MGCAVDFTAGDRVVRFQSGDAIIFNGGRAHGVMHGVRTCPRAGLAIMSHLHDVLTGARFHSLPPAAKVHANTGPLSLPKLRNARLSLQLRQQ